MDAIELLKMQHRETEKMFAMAKAATGATRRKLLLELADALTVHATIEERHFYPAVRERATEELLEDAFTEHLTMKSLLSGLVEGTVRMADFDAQLAALEGEVLHHVQDEERKLFPKVQQLLPAGRLQEIGDQMETTAAELENAGDPHVNMSVEIEPPQTGV